MINTKNYWMHNIISWTDQHLNANVSGDAQDRAWYEIILVNASLGFNLLEIISAVSDVWGKDIPEFFLV